MKRFSLICLSALFLPGCIYGFVNDANSGSGINTAMVRVLDGTCSGTGCGGTPTQFTNTSGLYVFDAYGDTNGNANVKLITVSSGKEAVELLISKPGYISRRVFHAPDYSTVTSGGNNYLISDLPTVYLCPFFAPDSDGDSICNAAESRYGTNPFSSDTDGDNLSDAAELFGTGGVDLRKFGADPLRKDLFIEADYYPGLKPADAAIDMVVDAFADAPVSNPDGSTGISLHIDVDDQIAAGDVDNNLSPAWTDFDVIKNQYFESRRAPIFHYALFANQYNGGTSSGLSRGIPGHDFIVSLGTWSTPGGTVLQQAGTLMHEFGHNLNLRHGGNQNANRKPNYLSVMSYNYQVRGLRIDGTDGNMDYSRLRIAGVNESSLNEFLAMSPLAGTSEADLARYGVRDNNSWLTGTASANLDFDEDGAIEWSVSRDLNGDGDSTDFHAASQNDWDNLSFAGAGTIGDPLLGADELQARATYNELAVIAEHNVEQCLTEEESKISK